MNAEISPFRVVVKALCLFVVINILYAFSNPQGVGASGYNLVFPGRTRLPFGVGGDPYSVAIENVDSTFPSHAIAAPKGANEFRVVMLGDSSLWGEDLSASEVISEQWNDLNTQCAGKTIKAYDLGYPHPSVLKDLVILDKAMDYEPDLIVWFVTLNTLISQRINPFLVANRERVADLLSAYDINFEQAAAFKTRTSFWGRTLIGQRSNLARSIKLEVLGIIWTATGEDTNRLALSSPPDFNISDDPRYRGLQPPQDIKDMLLFSALRAGHQLAGSVPVLIVNEPIYIAPEAKSPVRYNIVYPRWVYDQYREQIATQARAAGWYYLDLWSVAPPDYFSDTGFHLTVEGERLAIAKINPFVQSVVCDANQ